MLQANKLLIDKYCPMCRLYAAGFVKAGCIEPETITPYQTVSADILGTTDLERAKTEIALHNTKTGETRYGIDAMIHIVSHSHPIFNRLLRSFLVYSFLKFLYKFITYNRRVLYPCQEIETDRKCIPARHHGFRILLFSCSLILLLGAASPIFVLLNILPVPWYLMISIFSSFIFMIGFFRNQHLNQCMDFWGNMATVGILSTIGIWLIYFFKTIGILGNISSVLFLSGLVVLMMLEGRRRIIKLTK